MKIYCSHVIGATADILDKFIGKELWIKVCIDDSQLEYLPRLTLYYGTCFMKVKSKCEPYYSVILLDSESNTYSTYLKLNHIDVYNPIEVYTDEEITNGEHKRR